MVPVSHTTTVTRHASALRPERVNEASRTSNFPARKGKKHTRRIRAPPPPQKRKRLHPSARLKENAR
ncbi:hypothetical protein GQ44DRAFT_707817 [Phaeosphaeriaceae sp. PMI808]|nr:hypothetical protein GQ44DRAFT_707817 [Phaeosphaeriaceae sp. PMI808]